MSVAGRRMRVAYGRFFHEANVYSPLCSTLENFERFQHVAGEELAQHVRRDRWELPGLIPYAELSGFAHAARKRGDVETVPILSAMAVPSGKLTAEAYRAIRDDFTARVAAAAPLDGVYVAMHGSMRVEGMDGPPEADFLRAVRAAAGPGARVAASLDLHANLSAPIVEAVDVVQSFRANPHWDLAPTGFRAARTLFATIAGEVRPESAWRKLPVVLGGGVGISFLAPARAVFQRMKRIARDRRVLNLSFNMVHPFSDADDLGWTVHVSVDRDRDLAERLADELAEAAWEIRRHPLPDFLGVDAALGGVRGRSRLHGGLPSSLIDMGDNVLSGTSGGSTHLLGDLLARELGMRIYVPLHDPALVAAAGEAVGREAELEARGTPGMELEPLALRGRVVRVADGTGGRLAHLDLGEVQLVASETPPLCAHPRYYREAGLDPRAADAIVQKSFFQYRLLYLGTSHHHLPVATPGPSDLRYASHRPFPEPVYPREDPPDWRPFDRIQRGL